MIKEKSKAPPSKTEGWAPRVVSGVKSGPPALDREERARERGQCAVVHKAKNQDAFAIKG